MDAAIATKYGLSGKVKAKRIYSPESNNNPKGLFVSPSFNIAKRFATCGVVIEFNVKVGQLEAPVWPKGSYTIQGQMASYFKDDEEREKKRSEMRDVHKASNDKNVAKSDRPELSATLAKMAETQALYVGDLNPNMIRAVWYNETLHKNNRINGPWDRITVKDFYKLVPEKTFKYTDDYHNHYVADKIRGVESKVSKPNDDLDDKLLKALADDYDISVDELIKILKKAIEYESGEIEAFLWPKQIKQFKDKYL